MEILSKMLNKQKIIERSVENTILSDMLDRRLLAKQKRIEKLQSRNLYIEEASIPQQY